MGLLKAHPYSLLFGSPAARVPLGNRGSVALRRRISPGLPLSEYGWGQVVVLLVLAKPGKPRGEIPPEKKLRQYLKSAGAHVTHIICR